MGAGRDVQEQFISSLTDAHSLASGALVRVEAATNNSACVVVQVRRAEESGMVASSQTVTYRTRPCTSALLTYSHNNKKSAVVFILFLVNCRLLPLPQFLPRGRTISSFQLHDHRRPLEVLNGMGCMPVSYHLRPALSCFFLSLVWYPFVTPIPANRNTLSSLYLQHSIFTVHLANCSTSSSLHISQTNMRPLTTHETPSPCILTVGCLLCIVYWRDCFVCCDGCVLLFRLTFYLSVFISAFLHSYSVSRVLKPLIFPHPLAPCGHSCSGYR